MEKTIICELCTSNILRGIVYQMKNGFYVCSDCKDELEKIKGIEFDGREIP